MTVETGPGWELRLGDCIKGMRTLADDSVDVTITDPPYDEHTHKSGRRGHTGYTESESSSRATFNRTRDLGFEPITAAQMRESAVHIARVTRRWALLFCSVEMVSDWKRCIEDAGLKYIRTCAWRKVGSTPQFSGDRPAQAFETIVCAHRPGRTKWNAHGKHGYYEHPIVLERGNGVSRLHTTQKPLTLMAELVADFSNADELVMDPFAGSASTGKACQQLNRRFLGFELNRDYFDIACRRLRGEEAKPNPAQPSLFGGTP